MNLPPLPEPFTHDYDLQHGAEVEVPFFTRYQMETYARNAWNAALEAAAKAVIGDASKAAIRALRMK